MREIPLTRGLVALVDDIDYPRLSKWKWFAHPSGLTYYACRSHAGRAETRMHAEILRAPPGHIPDHRNGNGLDNRRCNLRPATWSQNAINRRIKVGRSGFRGVSWNRGKWNAKIRVEYRHIYLGRFDTAEEAAAAYDAAAKRLHGEFARLNFPDQEAA